jgi:hypothetical protein
MGGDEASPRPRGRLTAMRIAVVNPNSTRTMSDVITAAARCVADVPVIGIRSPWVLSDAQRTI